MDSADMDSPIEIQRMVFNNEEYSIGHLYLLPQMDEEQGPLEVKSHIGAQAGRGLKPYQASFENTGRESITAYSVEFPLYENVQITYQVDSNTEMHSVLAGSQLDVQADFSACSNLENAEVYYVTPILNYEYQGKSYRKCQPCYISGLDLSEEDVCDYLKRYQP